MVSGTASNREDQDSDTTIGQTDVEMWLNKAAMFNGHDLSYWRSDTNDIGAISAAHDDVHTTDFNNLLMNFNSFGENAPNNT